MRIVFFTSERFPSNEVFSYMFANVAAAFDDVHVVAVRRPAAGGHLKKLRRIWRYGTGPLNAIELVSSYPLQKYLVNRDKRRAEARVRALSRPQIKPQAGIETYVDTVNGPDAVGAISKLEPDVLIQFDAGILKPQVFKLARIGTLNMHPGIAPLIKGRDSIYWALWAREPRWLGATVHYIDEGIDTGSVLAYAPVEPLSPGEPYPSLFERVHRSGIEKLVEVLSRLASGERWTVEPPTGERVYRSTISGWRLGIIELRRLSKLRSSQAQ